MRASAPPVGRSAPEAIPRTDPSAAALAAAEVVAAAQGLTVPRGPRTRRLWLTVAEALAEHSPETIRAAVVHKLKSEPRRWQARPLLPRYLAEDMPAILRELCGSPQTADERPDDLYDLSAVMAACRRAGLLEAARAARKAKDWPILRDLYRRAQCGDRHEVAA